MNENQEQPDRPISRLRRDHKRRSVWWWIAALVFVLAMMIVLPELLARLG